MVSGARVNVAVGIKPPTRPSTSMNGTIALALFN